MTFSSAGGPTKRLSTSLTFGQRFFLRIVQKNTDGIFYNAVIKYLAFHPFTKNDSLALDPFKTNRKKDAKVDTGIEADDEDDSNSSNSSDDEFESCSSV